MSLVKTALEYRTLTSAERKAYVDYAKKNEEKTKKLGAKVGAGLWGTLGGVAGGALAHDYSHGSKVATGLGALVGAAALGTGGYHLAKAQTEMDHDIHYGRMNRPDKKWLITNGHHAKVMKGVK